VPKVVNDMIDANLEIELELENVVREFVEEGGRRICEPLNEKLSEKSVNSEKSVANSSEKNVANSTEGANSTNSNTPLITITAFKDNLLIMIPNYHQQIKLFIKDPQIVNFLLESLTNVILVTYEKYVVSLEEEREEDFMEVDALSVFLEDLTSQN
jgi:conserved oligomeric Golgi complex subunit 3